MSVKGYTLVEMLVSIFLILLIFTVMFSIFQISEDTYQSLFNRTAAEDNLRFLCINLETQIMHSDIIYIANDTVYFRDMETPVYFNYYYCYNNTLYKVKTTEKLNPIGSGSTSQYARGIIKYDITYVDGAYIQVNIESRIMGDVYSINREIPYGGKMITIE